MTEVIVSGGMWAEDELLSYVFRYFHIFIFSHIEETKRQADLKEKPFRFKHSFLKLSIFSGTAY